ncbi:MAG: hypothetical protein HY908_02115 [Myxococcales bacterium]|nr:hypothetical protein [Myxococcales bacterium]
MSHDISTRCAVELQIAALEGRTEPRTGRLTEAERTVFRSMVSVVVRETRAAQARRAAAARRFELPPELARVLAALGPAAAAAGARAYRAEVARRSAVPTAPSGRAALPPPAQPSPTRGWLA